MKKFALHLLLVSSATVATIHTAEKGKRIHGKENPRAAVLAAIEAAQAKEVQRALKGGFDTTGLLPHAIKHFDSRNVDTATILTLITKQTPRAQVQAALNVTDEKSLSKQEKTRLQAIRSLVAKAIRHSSSSSD